MTDREQPKFQAVEVSEKWYRKLKARHSGLIFFRMDGGKYYLKAGTVNVNREIINHSKSR